MRLYQPQQARANPPIQSGGTVLTQFRRLLLAAVIGALTWLAAACAPPRVSQGQITISVTADGETREVSLQAGTTAGEALQQAGVEIGSLDRSEPPLFTVLTDGTQVRLIRVREEFEVEEEVIAYETQVVRNESLPEGERRLIQPGVNGLREITYRRVFEDEVETSRNAVKTVIVKEPVPEVVMVGSQAPFAAISIPGRLAYIAAGNAWILEGNTGNRRPVVTTGDLDGRVFSLSPDGSWLLYTRADEDEDVINTLWAVRVEGETNTTVDLEVENVVHYAGWEPGSTTHGVAFSTVEPSPTAPGWQANNDLRFLNFSDNGWVSVPRTAIEPNSGGVYGWWGTGFAWSPNGGQLAYARPDGIGLVNLESWAFEPLMEITPLLTRSDWAWMPEVSWGPEGRTIYTVDHAPQEGLVSPEESPLFDLTAVPLEGSAPLALVPQVGMFSHPLPSPAAGLPSGEESYLIAFLQAITPVQSDTSGYRLVVMDRDGSNRRVLFPPEGSPGLEPQRFAWAPSSGATEDGEAGHSIALIYQGDLWLVDLASGEASQLTGDGQTSGLDWR